MNAKKPKPEGSAKLPIAERLVLRDGGDDVPAVDVMVRWILDHASMASLENPVTRATGRAEIRKIAAEVLRVRWSTLQSGAKGGAPKKPDAKPDGTPNVGDRSLRRRKKRT